MKNDLISLAQEANALEQLILEAGGELNETLEKWFDEIGAQLEQKADNYAFIMDKLDASSQMLRDRSKRYANAAKAVENAHERLKNRIKEALHTMGKDEIAGHEISFRLSNSAPRLVVNEAQLDPAYKMVVTTSVVDKEKIIEALKSGVEVAGAHFEPVKALRVRVSK